MREIDETLISEGTMELRRALDEAIGREAADKAISILRLRDASPLDLFARGNMPPPMAFDEAWDEVFERLQRASPEE